MPRPGSHSYDIKRSRLRKWLEDEGVATGQEADDEANRRLQEEADMSPVTRGDRDRAAGPKSER